MNLGNFNKQPVEVKDYDIDYTEWLTQGDSVQGATVVVVPTGLTVDSIFTSDKTVKLWLSGGTTGTQYKLTVTTTTEDGRVKEDEFKVRVRDV